jgi:hypothetical protein
MVNVARATETGEAPGWQGAKSGTPDPAALQIVAVRRTEKMLFSVSVMITSIV